MTNSIRQVQGQFADASGHTDFLGTLDEAVTTIFDSLKKSGKWLYINAQHIILDKYDDGEAAHVRGLLDAMDEPFFTVAGKLQGGASVN